MKTYYVYILKCSDDSYYTGITNSLEKRIEQHNAGIDTNCYTFNKRPVQLMYYSYCYDVKQAIEKEKQIKGWSRKKKEALINENWELLKELAVCKNESSHRYYKKEEVKKIL